MLTLLGSLLGFVSAAFPKIFEFFQQKQDNQLKMKMLEMNLTAAKEGKEFDLKIFNEKKDFEEQRLLIQHDMMMRDNKLSASVRPVITYLFFIIFALVKLSVIWHAMSSENDFYTAMQIAWDEETQAIFAAVISFWFGSRAFQKQKR